MQRSARQCLAVAAVTIAGVGFQSAAIAQGQKCTSTTCGVVQNVQYVEQKGSGSGVGLVAGGVVGGVLGHQIGSGRGNTAATIIGAGAGAYAGNEIEKNKNKKSYWTVAIRMDGGQNRTFTYSNQPTVRQGERVMLIDGGKRLALVAG